MDSNQRVSFLFLVVALLWLSACKHTKATFDPCSLVTKADIEKIVQTTVDRTLVEPTRAMSMADGKVMHSTASCSYYTAPAEGKPARIKIEVDRYGDPVMLQMDFTTWKGAQRVDGIGDKALQDTTVLQIQNQNVILMIETDQTSESPREPIPPSPETQGYPAIQTQLARLALGRL